MHHIPWIILLESLWHLYLECSLFTILVMQECSTNIHQFRIPQLHNHKNKNISNGSFIHRCSCFCVFIILLTIHLLIASCIQSCSECVISFLLHCPGSGQIIFRHLIPWNCWNTACFSIFWCSSSTDFSQCSLSFEAIASSYFITCNSAVFKTHHQVLLPQKHILYQCLS